MVGAYSFSSSQNCPTALANGIPNLPRVIAFVDFYEHPNAAIPCNYPNCGTKSISLNLDHAWSLDSNYTAPGMYDVQSTLAHEFGHTLGLAHMEELGACIDGYSQTCTQNQDKNTMTNYVHKGDSCQRSLSNDDISSAQYLYP